MAMALGPAPILMILSRRFMRPMDDLKAGSADEQVLEVINLTEKDPKRDVHLAKWKRINSVKDLKQDGEAG